VVVADDEALFRSGLRLILDTQADVTVVAEAEDGRQAVGAAQEHRPDVVLMDIQMPGTDGIAATRELSRLVRDCRVLVLTTFDLE